MPWLFDGFGRMESIFLYVFWHVSAGEYCPFMHVYLLFSMIDLDLPSILYHNHDIRSQLAIDGGPQPDGLCESFVGSSKTKMVAKSLRSAIGLL